MNTKNRGPYLSPFGWAILASIGFWVVIAMAVWVIVKWLGIPLPI